MSFGKVLPKLVLTLVYRSVDRAIGKANKRYQGWVKGGTIDLRPACG